jgi:hypothetical protein
MATVAGTPQRAPVRDQDHRRLAAPASPARPRALDELPHFLECQTFARPALRLQKPPRGRCPIYGVPSRLSLAVLRG